ncbi:MAG: PAS domain S-box protein [Thermodesulfobacteriota bacterium]
MKDDLVEEPLRFRLLVGLFGLAAAGLGLIAFIGLIFGPPFLASLGTDKIPMAPSTALFFFLYGLIIFLHARRPMSRGIRWLSLAINVTGAVLALLLLFLSYNQIYLDYERLGLQVAGAVGGAPIGHMSPLTAFCFLLASLSFLASLSRFSNRTRPTTIAFWSAGSLVVICLALLLAYLYGMPLLYGSAYIPPAATTSLAFLALGIALLVLAVSRDRSSGDLATKERHFSYLLILFFTILTVGIVAAGYFYYRHHEIHYRVWVENQLSAIADLKVGEMVQWRKERLADAALYHKNDNFSGLVRRYLENPQDVEARERLEIWLGKIRAASRYDRVILLDVQGTVRMSEPKTPENFAPHLIGNVSEVLGSGKVTFLDFHRDAPDGPVYLAVLIPILKEQDGGLPLGALVLRINPETYLYPLLQSWPGNSHTAETLLVRREGDYVLFLNELRFQKNTALNLKIPLSHKDLPALQAVLGQEGIVEGRDYRGVPVVASVRAVPDSPWFLVARMDISEVYEPLRERSWMIIILVGSLLIGAGAGMGLVWRQRQSRFYQERYEAAEALRASEVRYRRTLDSMLEGCQIIGFDWRYLYVNEETVKQSRRTREELLGHKIMDVFPGITSTKTFAVLQRCLEERSSICLENEFTYPDGAQAWFYLSIEPVPEGIFILSMDITERKQAEKREKHLTALIRAIRKVNQLITKEKDRDRLILGACENLVATRGFNGAWISLLDSSGKSVYSAQSGLGENFRPLQELLERGQPPQCVSQALAQNEVVITTDTSHDCPNCPLASSYQGNASFCVKLEHGGKVYGILTASVPYGFALDQEERTLFQEVGDDIAFGLYNIEQEEKRNIMVKELSYSEERFKNLFEYAPDAYYLHDLEGRFIEGNRAAEKLSGYTKEELLGRNLLELALLSPEGRRQAAELLRKNAQGLPTGPDELVINRKDGRQVFIEIRTFPLALKGQDMVLGLARDISERKTLEQQLQQSQKLEAVGRLSGGIAHDFNNLLTAILGNAEYLLAVLPKDDPRREEIEEIQNAGERAAALTRQLLAFSRKQVLQPQIMNLNKTARDMEKMLRRMIGEDIELKTILAPDLGQIEADMGQIEQVIMNLVVNARDALARGGKITIETRNVELDQEYARTHVAVTPGPYAMLSVSDTGLGMSREVQAKIFEPFFTTKGKGQGTGLGLAMVYGIVKQSNGNIWVYSEPGKGTTFKIYLPRIEKPTAGLETKAKRADTPTGSETILVVEDDEMVRNFVVKVLKGFGYQVLTAARGEEAVEVSRKHRGPIHLLLTDVVMPGMNSRDMESSLITSRPEMKVLFMSGYTDDTIVHHGVLDPGKAFLAKPLTPESLGRKVREVLDSPEATGSSR